MLPSGSLERAKGCHQHPESEQRTEKHQDQGNTGYLKHRDKDGGVDENCKWEPVGIEEGSPH